MQCCFATSITFTTGVPVGQLGFLGDLGCDLSPAVDKVGWSRLVRSEHVGPRNFVFVEGLSVVACRLQECVDRGSVVNSEGIER